MIPLLFDASERQFDNMGLGPLNDALECTIEREINGIYQLHMIYPADGLMYSQISTKKIICAAPYKGVAPQPFDIFRVTKLSGERIEIDARHVSYRLSNRVVMPFSLTDATVDTVASRIINGSVGGGSGFNVYNMRSDANTKKINFSIDVPCSAKAALMGMEGSLLDVIGGEIAFGAFGIYFYEDGGMGSEKDVTAQYGINLADFQRETSIEDRPTGVMPYWKGRNASGEDVVVLLSASLSDVVVYNDLRRSDAYSLVVPLDLSDKFDTTPTVDQLRQAASAYINDDRFDTGNASKTDLSFVRLSDSEEYKNLLTTLVNVALGDTILVINDKYNIATKQRIIRTVYDALKERYTSMTFGNLKTYSNERLQKDIAKNKYAIQAAQKAVETSYASGTPGTSSAVQDANIKRCKLVKTGKSVRCYMGIGYADGTTAIPAGTTLFTIPAGYRPKTEQIFPGTGFRSIGKTVVPGLEFKTNGTITHNSGSDITMLVGSAEWETN